MGWFFRAIEAQDGTWACRRGLVEFDVHGSLDEAVTHLAELARLHRPATLYAHWYDGRTEQVGELRPESSGEAGV